MVVFLAAITLGVILLVAGLLLGVTDVPALDAIAALLAVTGGGLLALALLVGLAVLLRGLLFRESSPRRPGYRRRGFT